MKIYTSVLRTMLFGMSIAVLSVTAKAVVLEEESSKFYAAQAADEPSTGRIIVKYKSSFTTAQTLSTPSSVSEQVSRTVGKKMKYIREMATGAHVMRVSRLTTNAELNQTIEALQADSAVAYAEVDARMQIMATPSDPQYNDQWHYYEATGGLNLPSAWDSSTGEGVVVAVIDTGYTEHADLTANILPGYDMISDAATANDGDGRDSDARDTGDATTANECNDGRGARSSSWHGTHVAGTVAAATNNSRGVAGVAYNAKVVPIRALGKCGGFLSDIADGMIWAAGGSVSGLPANANPAQVLNLSLGGGGSCGASYQAAIDQAVSLGATVVVAAGNSNQNAANARPANCASVVAVAATNRNGGRASYSNFGNAVDVAAPGGGIGGGVLSTVDIGQGVPAGDGYAPYQGTSMAAPHVAGAVALMYSLDADITPAEVENLLESTARSFPSTCSGCGAGIVDADAVVAAVSDGPVLGKDKMENGVPITGLSGATGSERFYTLEVPAGTSNLNFQLSDGSGDADLYVRYATRPTVSSYDCRPWRTGNNETCSFASPQSGTYHVMVRGYRAFSGVTLQATFQ